MSNVPRRPKKNRKVPPGKSHFLFLDHNPTCRPDFRSALPIWTGNLFFFNGDALARPEVGMDDIDNTPKGAKQTTFGERWVLSFDYIEIKAIFVLVIIGCDDRHISESVFASFIENLQIFYERRIADTFYARALSMLLALISKASLHTVPSVECYQ